MWRLNQTPKDTLPTTMVILRTCVPYLPTCLLLSDRSRHYRRAMVAPNQYSLAVLQTIGKYELKFIF